MNRSQHLRPARDLAPPVPEVPYDRPAVSRLAAYRCERGHAFGVRFAAEAPAPAEWSCRCGAAAVPDGAAWPPAAGRAGAERERRMGQLLARRSVGELDALLTERLTQLRAARE